LKKVFAIFLCGTVLFNTVGFIILFTATTFEWKRFIAEELEKKSNGVQLVKIADDPSIQYLNKHEIICGGKLYDIERVTKENGVAVLYCYHDNNEEKIDAQLVNGLQQNTDSAPQNSIPSKLLVKLAAIDYIAEKKMEFVTVTLSSSEVNHFSFSIVPGTILSIQAPPPRG